MRGLRVQLALFYLALSLPALVLIEHLGIAIKFERCLGQLDDGRVQRVLDAQARTIAIALAEGARGREVEVKLERFVLRLERPRESLGTSAAYVLLELAERPFRAVVLDASGHERWASGAPVGSSRGQVHRRWSAPIASWPAAQSTHPAAGGQLVLELSVPSPWRRFDQRLSFEWPIAVWFLGVFLLGSAWFLRRRVLVRIESMGRAASAWARGDFAISIDDRGRDEIGALADDLDRMASELKALVSARTRLATFEERRRLARDLHDTVKQKVFALSLQLAAAREGGAEPERTQRRIAEAITLVEEVQRELAEQLRELSEGDDGEQDLVPALRQRLIDFERRSGSRVDPMLPDSLVVSAPVAEGVLRIVDEALSNVWRHAEATRIEVSLVREGAKAALTVSDDGRGGAGESPSGMGLSNMRQRAEALPGGRFVLHSEAGGGTQVRLVFDLPAPPRPMS